MSPRLVHVVRAIDPDVTGDGIADALWLARHMGGARDLPAGPVSGAPAIPPAPDIPPARTGGHHRRPGGGAKEQRPPVDTAVLRPARQRGGLPDEGGIPARSPGVPAVPSALAICRALRPLRRRVPSTVRSRPDEVATADWIAESGLWVPVTRPVPERWLDVALVVDDSASMSVWSQTVLELRTILRQAGVFRDVRVWYLDGDLRRGPGLSVSGVARECGAGRDPREIIDPAARRLVLVASDCVGCAWASGATTGALRAWSAAGPTAILQMLPQRLWPGCGPTFSAVRFASAWPGLPNDRLQVRGRHGDVDVSLAGTPIPVLELESRWLAPWASLVAGTTGEWINGVALFTGLQDHAPQEDGTETPAAEPVVRAGELLSRFRAHASPEAYQLSVCLSAAPLTLPVMRLVQRALLPASRPAHLAEVFLSGLLRRVGPANDGVAPDDVEYDFQRGVRVELLGELARQDALQVLSRVSGFVSQRLGSALDFRALLTTDTVSGPIPELSPPFARVAYQVLRSLGGRYADAAERLLAMLEGSQRASDTDRVFVGTQAGDAYAATIADSDSQYPGAAYSGADRGDRLTGQGSAGAASRRALPAVMRGVPSRNPHFTGRHDLLEQLHTQLVNTSERTALLPHALHGLGGVGKTQLAVEYVHRYDYEYDLIWWVPAEDPAQVRACLVELAGEMELPTDQEVKRTVGAVLDALRTGKPGRWLLVFDNADQPDELAPYLPYPTGHVLITSRNIAWSDVASTVEVDVLDRHESMTLLRERVRNLSEDDADSLADRLGDLPLALAQAAAWLAETGMSAHEYLRLFDDQFEQLTQTPPAGYPASVGATYRVVLEQLRDQSPGAADLLDICAFLGPAPIPVAVLWEGRHADLPADLGHTLRDAVSFRRAVREIGRYALARVDPVEDRITVHRLVQLVVRAGLDDEGRQATRRIAQQILAMANPGEPDKTRNWQRHSELAPHVLPAGLIDAEDTEARRVVLDQIRYRWVRGDYESCRELGEQTVKTWSDLWDADDELTLIARRHLANALRAVGENQQARDLAQDTLVRMRRVFGDDHEHTMHMADNVSWDLRISGNFTEALRIDQDNLARCRRVLGDDDPFTLKVTNNLAADLRWLGDFEAARTADLESVQRRRQIYGDEDRNTLLSLSSLARDLYGLGDYAEGLRIQEDALPIQRRILGLHHSEVLLETRNLVILLRKTGEYVRAKNLVEELFRTYQQQFGLRHERALAAMVSYSNLLRVMGELSTALELAEDALVHYRDQFGAEHTATLACAANLAITRRHLDQPESALDLNAATLAAFERVLGTSHRYTLCCATNTANDLAALHEHTAAFERSTDILERSRAVRGENHPYTLACLLNAALDRQATGDRAGAEPLLTQAVTRFGRRLGVHHPETLAASAHKHADCDIELPET